MIKGEDLQRPTYTCLQTIGEGTVGVCRKGVHDVFGTEIVQKTISVMHVPDGIAHEPRLLEEADHPHIIKVREAQWDPEFKGVKAVTFVCPYYPGGSVLDAFRAGHVFSVEAVVGMARNILDALAYLHGAKQYLHRDVKPGNILLDEGRVGGCLADLGSAARLTDGETENRGGTPLYIDPAAKVSGRMTVQSDLYGLGVTMAEMLRGRFPYESVDNQVVETRLSEGRRALPDAQFALPVETPPVVARFIRSLINPDPSRRPPSAEAALRRLNKLQYLAWRRVSGSGLLGVWTARWPVTGRATALTRTYRLEAAEVTTGRRKGEVQITVMQRKPGGEWRRIQRLCGYAPTGDAAALSAAFRSVEQLAQA